MMKTPPLFRNSTARRSEWSTSEFYSLAQLHTRHLVKCILVPASSHIGRSIVQNHIGLRSQPTSDSYVLPSQFLLDRITTFQRCDILLERLDVVNRLDRHQIDCNNRAFYRHLLCSHLRPFKSQIHLLTLPASGSSAQINKHMRL